MLRPHRTARCASSCRRRPRAARVAVRIDELPGETVYLQVARGVRVRRAPGGRSGVWRGRAAVLHRQRRPRTRRRRCRCIRVRPRRQRASRIAVEIANPTSLALGPGRPHVRVEPLRRPGLQADGGRPRGSVSPRASGRPPVWRSRRTGACSWAIAPGSILRVTPDREVETFATIPASVAAFHLAMGPDDCLYVTAPTLATHDAIYRISRDRLVDVVVRRPRPAAGPGVRFHGRAVRRGCARRRRRFVSAGRQPAGRRTGTGTHGAVPRGRGARSRGWADPGLSRNGVAARLPAETAGAVQMNHEDHALHVLHG